MAKLAPTMPAQRITSGSSARLSRISTNSMPIFRSRPLRSDLALFRLAKAATTPFISPPLRMERKLLSDTVSRERQMRSSPASDKRSGTLIVKRHTV